MTPADRIRDHYRRVTRGIGLEHRHSFGDEVHTNMSQRALNMATAFNRSWFVIFTVYWSSPDGEYFDQYKYEFQSCTLTDQKSIDKFEALRDHILTVEKAKGNQAQYSDWGWFATPWESRHKHIESGEKILVASFK
jgi:hypothetical protein